MTLTILVLDGSSQGQGKEAEMTVLDVECSAEARLDATAYVRSTCMVSESFNQNEAEVVVPQSVYIACDDA